MSTDSPSISDADLIQQSRNGDQSAYGEIVQRYQSLVCSVAYSRCGDLTLSEDLAQEAFVQAWKKLADLSDVTKFKSWICTIVRNLANRSREKSSRIVDIGAARLDSVVEPVSAADEPIERVISAEQEQLVWQTLAGIPESYREPMILFYREEQSISRVAEALEISQDAVKQRLSRGRKFLQEELVATVETTLKKSKPSNSLAGAVILGLSGEGSAATAGTAATVVGKTAMTGTGFFELFFMSIAQLPMIVWLLKISLSESRSPRERQLVVEHIFWQGLYIAFFAIFFQSIFVMFCGIPLISWWMGKRVKELRIEENTATPYRAIVADQEKRGDVMRLFVGSGLAVMLWPAVILIVGTDWFGIGLLLLSTMVVSLTGASFCGKRPITSFRVFGFSLGTISLIGIGVIHFREAMWAESFSDYSSWSFGTMQAMLMTQVILSVVVWKRVFGKPKQV